MRPYFLSINLEQKIKYHFAKVGQKRPFNMLIILKYSKVQPHLVFFVRVWHIAIVCDF